MACPRRQSSSSSSMWTTFVENLKHSELKQYLFLRATSQWTVLSHDRQKDQF